MIPSGARIEREVDYGFSKIGRLRLTLREADFTTTLRIENNINRAYRLNVARMLDAGTVVVDITKTKSLSPAHAISKIENLVVEPERKARVVVDQRSGKIVVGEDVRISHVAISLKYSRNPTRNSTQSVFKRRDIAGAQNRCQHR